MDDTNQLIAQAEQKIETGDFKEAYSLVNKVLLNFPDNGKALRLKQKIEKTVYHKMIS